MESEISDQLAKQGLSCLASVDLTAEEAARLPNALPSALSRAYSTVHLIGTAGASIWPAFSRSDEYCDGLPDPLDRWSRRIMAQIAAEFGVMAAHPSDGPPYWPVVSWATRSGQYSSSPLGLAIHHRLGLWTSFRGLLFGHRSVARPEMASPCDSCRDKPCLTACPVGAFTNPGYDVTECADALIAGAVDCATGGCRARLACPIGGRANGHDGGSATRYDPAQIAFHMDRFVESRRSVKPSQ